MNWNNWRCIVVMVIHEVQLGQNNEEGFHIYIQASRSLLIKSHKRNRLCNRQLKQIYDICTKANFFLSGKTKISNNHLEERKKMEFLKWVCFIFLVYVYHSE